MHRKIGLIILSFEQFNWSYINYVRINLEKYTAQTIITANQKLDQSCESSQLAVYNVWFITILTEYSSKNKVSRLAVFSGSKRLNRLTRYLRSTRVAKKINSVVIMLTDYLLLFRSE